MKGTADQAPQANVFSVIAGFLSSKSVSVCMYQWIHKYVFIHVHLKAGRFFTCTCLQDAEGDHSFCSFHSLYGQSVLGAQRPEASQCAVLSVIPAHEADSHHKAPIVLAGRIGSHSVCHSAATCITRRHSGACFCFCFLLSCLPYRATPVPSLGFFKL